MAKKKSITVPDDIITDMKKLKKEFDAKMKAAIKPFRKAIFDKFMELLLQAPSVRGLQWTQGTPSWNDGDVCEFGVYSLMLDIPLSENDEDAIYEDEAGYIGEGRLPKEEIEVTEKLNELFTSIDEDIMKMTFGDGARVTMTKDSKDFEIDDYDEDY